MKLIKYLIYSVATILALIVGLLFFVQSEWAKDKIGLVLREIALQQGVRLKIEKIEGNLPLKWTLTGVHLQLSDTDTLEIDKIHLRLALFPLVRKHFTISYLSADKTIYRFTPKEGSSTPITLPLQSFSMRMVKFGSVEVINLTNGDRATYSAEGNCRLVKKGKAFTLFAKINSYDLDAKISLQGNKKTDQISADFNLHVKSSRAFAPFKILPVETAFTFETICTGPWKVWKTLFYPTPDELFLKPVIGELKLNVERLALPQLEGLDEKLTLTTQFSLLSNRMLDVSSLSFKSDLLCVKGNGKFNTEFYPTKVDASFLVPRLSRLTPTVEGIVKGDIRLDKEACQIIAKSERLDIQHTSFSDVELKIDSNNWTGTCTLTADHPDLGLKGETLFHLIPHQQLTLKEISLRGPKTLFSGDLVFDLVHFPQMKGGLAFQIDDLSAYKPLSPFELAGQAGGTLDFSEENIYCRGVAKDLTIDLFTAARIGFNLFATDVFKEFKGKLDIETHEAVLDELYLESLYGTIGWDVTDWLYSFQSVGEWKKPFDLSSRGRVSRDFTELTCDTLMGQLLEKNIYLQQPFTLTESKLSNFDLKIEDGSIQASLDYSPEQANLVVQASHFPLDFLTLVSERFSLLGLSSLDIDLHGAKDHLEGRCSLLLEQANIFPAGTTTPIQTKGTLQANFSNGVAQLHSHLVATGEQFVELSASFPFDFSLTPFKVSIDPHKPISGQCTMEGHAEQLFDFINLGTQRLGGFVSCDLILSGTMHKPYLFGPISLQGGFYQNYFIGMLIKDVNVDAMAQGSVVVANDVQAGDGYEGSSLSNAIFHLQPDLPFAIEGNVKHFRVIQFDWLTAACSGPFKITGNLEKGLAQGSLTVDEAEVHIPESLPADLPVLPVTFVNQPASYGHPNELHSEPYPFYYDLDIHGQDNIRLSGRGLEAELAGDLHLTGRNLTVSAIGSMQTKKGQFSFAGKDFNITQGELTFSESQTFLNITSTLDLPDLTATVIFRGALTAPELIFQSNPPLPTGALLARILFNKDVSELSASQALQLADTILTMSGGAGPNVMETIRQNLGIDRLSISASEETGQISVQVGKKIAKGVMITLSQSTESSQVLVEVELKGGFVLSAETQEDDQGKFTFKWNKNY